MIIDYIAIIISIIAIAFSTLSFYYIHLQGPKFRIEHLSVEIPELGNEDTVFRHTIAIINNGNKTGLLKDLIVKTNSSTNFLPRYLKISKGDKFISTVATMAIAPKESRIILYDYIVEQRVDAIPYHWIDVIFDETVGLDIERSEKTIWNYNKNQKISTPPNSPFTHSPQ